MLAKIKDKFQVTLPTELRRKGGFSVGDYVDIGINESNGRISLTSKSVVDRAIAQGRADYENGDYEIFDNAKEMVEFLRGSGKRRRR
jgi:bifunctional DNA-binding transcriptional regulator/antitoxin component of YhaV-PrlF toxin-antitoxin module